ncbi:DUF4160 domain-containing protein [Xanthomonas translucens pv. translucens]|nr:DUF4160 domain-containing protein [Xanthomonas translucens pv. translucens]QEO27589.1 DUF4160 domain-containing protein [Xanthomonas translucens pv. undulosa]
MGLAVTKPTHAPGTAPPRLRRCNGCTIWDRADHRPFRQQRRHAVRSRPLSTPFHVRTKDGREALTVIETLAVLSGHLSRRELSAALEWAAANKAACVTRWQELNP